MEAGTIRDRDQAQFKGIFARGLRTLMSTAGVDAGHRELFAGFLEENARSVVAKDRTADGLYGGLWEGPVDPHATPCGHAAHDCGNTTGPTPQTSAAMLLTAASSASSSLPHDSPPQSEHPP